MYATFQFAENSVLETDTFQKDGKSKTPEYFANTLMLNYNNAIIEDGLVNGYYNNGCKTIPSLPKYL